ncbi:methyl-accepting chemotaxis protein [Methylomonas albis]|uniref:Methyl-accepting chemotaxis protein n=1 Tax=Methylomonas albis TaxID=1854563 RepID=A0ABR9D6L0_9GAMM|nr:methyl-accepting chemotaxis protein [Methylomonas albis]MBD9358757.1 methyl-accepting chemotaxis protein [Methylomonas albis]
MAQQNKSSSLRSKLLMAYACSAIVIVIIGAFSFFGLYKALNSYRQDVNKMQDKALTVLHIQSEFKIQVQEWKNVLLRGKDNQKRDKYWQSFQEKEAAVRQDSENLAESLPVGKAKTKLNEFIAAHQKLTQDYRQGLAAYIEAGADPYIGDQAVTGIDRAATNLLNDVESEINVLVQQAISNAHTEAERGAQFGIIALLITFGVGIVSAYWIVRMLTQQLGGEPAYAVEAVTRIAHGDLNFEIQLKDNDQASLLHELNEMRLKLCEVVNDVRANANSVAGIAKQISVSAQTLSQAAIEQASGIEKTSSSVEQLNASVQQNAENAENTNIVANTAAIDANKSSEAVKRTARAMKDINSKISLIEDISYKTNLLSLNASIEAARSGQHGKGFAIVAAEVRKLADNSHAAAIDISELTQSSLEIAEQAGHLLTQTVPNIQKTADLIAKISASSTEQGIGIKQINQAMTQLDRATQQNASLSEQLASTAEDMNRQADQLQRSVAFFS